MSVIDQLEVIDGYFEDDSFYMRGIAGYAIEGRYKEDDLRSLARLIQEDEPFNIIIDSERTVFVPVELNAKIKQELFMIADELEEK
jgi:hypothetical protein